MRLASQLLLIAALACVDLTNSVRTIPWGPRSPVVEQIREGDTRLIVQRSWPDEVTFEHESTAGLFERIACHSDVILLGQIENLKPILVEEGTWLNTVVRVRPTDIIWTSAKWRSNDAIDVQLAGGEMAIGNTIIEADSARVARFRMGMKVLALLRLDNHVWTTVINTLLIADRDRVVYPWRSSAREATGLNSRKVLEVVATLKSTRAKCVG